MTEIMAKPAKPTPQITFPTVEGEQIQLGGKGRWQVAVVYRGRHCPLCRKYLATLNSLLDDFRSADAEVIAISSDPRERAKEEAAEEGWKFPVACELSQDQMRQLGLYISEPRSAQETDRPFAEPGLFITNPDGLLQVVDISNAPFARPDLQGVLNGLKFIQDKDYPIRGAAA